MACEMGQPPRRRGREGRGGHGNVSGGEEAGKERSHGCDGDNGAAAAIPRWELEGSPPAAVAPVLMVCTWMLDVPHGSPLVPVARGETAKKKNRTVRGLMAEVVMFLLVVFRHKIYL